MLIVTLDQSVVFRLWALQTLMIQVLFVLETDVAPLVIEAKLRNVLVRRLFLTEFTPRVLSTSLPILTKTLKGHSGSEAAFYAVPSLQSPARCDSKQNFSVYALKKKQEENLQHKKEKSVPF